MVNKNMTDIIDDLKDPLLLHQAEQYIDSVLGRAIITIEKLRKRVDEIERLRNVLVQYRDDLMYPPIGEQRERRIKMVKKLLEGK